MTDFIIGGSVIVFIVVVFFIFRILKSIKEEPPKRSPFETAHYQEITRNLLRMVEKWADWKQPVYIRTSRGGNEFRWSVILSNIYGGTGIEQGPYLCMFDGSGMDTVFTSLSEWPPDAGVWDLYTRWSSIVERFIMERIYNPDWDQMFTFTPVTYFGTMIWYCSQELLLMHECEQYINTDKYKYEEFLEPQPTLRTILSKKLFTPPEPQLEPGSTAGKQVVKLLNIFKKWFEQQHPTAGDLIALHIISQQVRWCQEALDIFFKNLERFIAPGKQKHPGKPEYTCGNIEITKSVLTSLFTAIKTLIPGGKKYQEENITIHLSSNGNRYDVQISFIALKKRHLKMIKNRYLPEYEEMKKHLGIIVERLGSFDPLDPRYYGDTKEKSVQQWVTIFRNSAISRTIADMCFQEIAGVKATPRINLNTLFCHIYVCYQTNANSESDEPIFILRFFGYFYLFCLEWWSYKKAWPQWDRSFHSIIEPWGEVMEKGEELGRKGVHGEVVRIYQQIKPKVQRLFEITGINFDQFRNAIIPDIPTEELLSQQLLVETTSIPINQGGDRNV
jgi:hypothetical protein